MNETITSTVVTTPEAKKPFKPKRSDEEKRAELYARKNKLLEQHTAVKKKSKDIEEQLAKANSKIQEYENKALYKICKELNISVKDIITFLERIPKGTSFDEIANRALREKLEQIHY